MSPPVLQTEALRGLTSWAAHEAIARIEAVIEALPSCTDPGVLEALARTLPDAVAELEPEVCAAVATLAAALVPQRPVIPRDLAKLEPRLRVAWQRVQIASGDAELLAAIDDVELGWIVYGWSVDPVLDPRALVQRLLDARDPRLRSILLGWVLPLVQQLAVTLAEAFAVLRVLAQDPDASIRGPAVARLGEGWLRAPSAAAEREREAVLVRALEDADVAVARAAIAAAASLGRREWLLELVLDDARSGLVRAQGLDALGPLARDEDLELALALAEHEPLRFAPPARRFLLAAHRHGVFVRAHHLAALLEQFDAHPRWTGEALVRVTFIVRVELVERLATLASDDPRWIRRASILAASVGTRAHVVLREQLERTRDLEVARALIEAAGSSPDYEGEAPLLAWLDALPEVVLPVLRVKGGPQAEACLRARVEDPRCARVARTQAMHVLWALSRDRGTLLRELSTQLGPHDAGLLDGIYVAHRDASLGRLLVQAPWPDDPHHAVEPQRKLAVLCESGDVEQRPAIEALFREVFRGYVRRALAGDFSIKRVALPELEQRLFRYGRHLVKAGRSVRRFIEPGPETGRDLVLQVAITWLHEEPAPAVCVALLELIGRHAPGATTLRLIEPLWRHGDREVRRAAIEAILAAGEDARGLELSICRLAAGEDPRIMVQALAAVGSLAAAWAEPMVLAALRRPEMAIKKEAAHALAQMGSPRAIEAIVGWLAHHDNRGFRSELLGALERAAGPSRVAMLVDALDAQIEPRRIELLSSALDHLLPLAAALRLARSSRASATRLLDACLEGRVALADASPHQLAAQLHLVKLRPTPPQDDPGRTLRLEGFSPAAARTLLEQRAPALESEVLATVGAGLAEWIAWLHHDGARDPRALALVLDAATPKHAEHVGALLELCEQQLPTVDPSALMGFLERSVAGQPLRRELSVRAIGLLRRLPRGATAGGLRRHRLLGRLGALRTRADLDRSLDECRAGPEYARDAATLLCEVLRIPTATTDERPEITAMREQAERWHGLDDATRRAWLTAQLAERPLDVVTLEPTAAPAKPRFEPSALADLESLLAMLREGDEQERSRAALRLLDWPDARPTWPQILDAFLGGRIRLDGAHRARLAVLLERWPQDPLGRRHATELWPYCTPWQQRALVRIWVDAWREGDAGVVEPLQSCANELLLPVVWEAAERGDFRLVSLLRPDASLALRHLIAWVGERSPAAVAHLIAPEPEAEPDDAEDPEDPIEGREPDELVAIIAGKQVDKGLAVRAVHALVAHGERGVAPLERLAVDPRPPVRSAALRVLRQVATREQTLAATAHALAMETRRDVILSLMKSLGHGRHEPSLPALLERLVHSDLRVREGAHAAIRAWGHAVLPALRRAARRARPDRRPHYSALIDELEQMDA